MAERKEKPKTWSRKGRCPSCDVGTGSAHKPSCTFTYPEKKVRKMGKAQLIESLNIIDEFACEADSVMNNDNGEARKLEKHYNRLFDYLNAL